MSQAKLCTISLEVNEEDGHLSTSELRMTFTGSSGIDLASFLMLLGNNLRHYQSIHLDEVEDFLPGDRLDAHDN